MGKKVALPTMSIFGIVTNPDIIAEKLFLYFLTSEYSQSVSFYGKISSLKYLLNKYATNPKELESEVRDTLIELYKHYFKNVNVDVEVIRKDPHKVSSTLSLVMHIVCESENGVISTVEEELTTSGTTISNLLELIYRK